jgi:transposase
MQWEDYHTRIAIIGLFKSGKSALQIFALLGPHKMSERFVYRTIKRYSDTGDVVDIVKSGRPRSVRTKKAIEAVQLKPNQSKFFTETKSRLSKDENQRAIDFSHNSR